MTTTTRRAWTLVAPTQLNKSTTVNDRIQDIENALDDILTKDLGAGNVTLSSAEWAASGAFHFNGTSTSGRTMRLSTRERGARKTWRADSSAPMTIIPRSWSRRSPSRLIPAPALPERGKRMPGDRRKKALPVSCAFCAFLRHP